MSYRNTNYKPPRSRLDMHNMSDNELTKTTFGYQIGDNTVDEGGHQLDNIMRNNREHGNNKTHYAPNQNHGKRFLGEEDEEFSLVAGMESMQILMQKRRDRSEEMMREVDELKNKDPEEFKKKYGGPMPLLFGNDDDGTINSDIYAQMAKKMQENQATPGTFLSGYDETAEEFLDDNHLNSSDKAVKMMLNGQFNNKTKLNLPTFSIKEFTISSGAEVSLDLFKQNIDRIEVKIGQNGKYGLQISKKGIQSKQKTIDIQNEKNITGSILAYFEDERGFKNVSMKLIGSANSALLKFYFKK